MEENELSWSVLPFDGDYTITANGQTLAKFNGRKGDRVTIRFEPSPMAKVSRRGIVTYLTRL